MLDYLAEIEYVSFSIDGYVNYHGLKTEASCLIDVNIHKCASDRQLRA